MVLPGSSTIWLRSSLIRFRRLCVRREGRLEIGWVRSMSEPENGFIPLLERKGKFWLVSFAGLLALAVALIVGRNREPHYQGLNLTQWLALHQSLGKVPKLPSESFNAESFNEWVAGTKRAGINDELAGRITNALHHLKPQALPLLVKWTAYEQPGWQKFLCRRLPFLMRYSLGRQLCADRRDAIGKLGLEGFRILGAEAAPAVPDLVRRCSTEAWGRRPSAASRTWTAIQTTGEEGAIELAKIARHERNCDRATALDLLAHAGSWTSLDNAAPLFVVCLKDKQTKIAVRTAQVLRNWGDRLPNMLPALVEALRDSRPQVRQAAAEALGQALSSHRVQVPSAVPALLGSFSDPDPEVRSTATNAIRQIISKLLD